VVEVGRGLAGKIETTGLKGMGNKMETASVAEMGNKTEAMPACALDPAEMCAVSRDVQNKVIQVGCVAWPLPDTLFQSQQEKEIGFI
jgi:hypothetical protein